MQDATLGFIGLGVMGTPMCRNLARKSGRPIVAFDVRRPAPENTLAARSVAEVAQRADVVFLSLPGERQIREVCEDLDKGKPLVDCSTALELACSAGLDLQAASTARRMLEQTVALGLGDAYHTAVLEAVRRQETK